MSLDNIIPGQLGMATPFDELIGKTNAEIRAELADYVALGVDWLRIDISWEMVQPSENGAFTWTKVKSLFNLINEAGIEIVAVLGDLPAWTDTSMASEEARQAYADFTSAAVRNVGNLVDYWEIVNEPNKAGIAPADYAELLKLAYPIIKAGNAEDIVISGGTAAVPSTGDGMWGAVDYLEQMYANGAKDYFDALGYHPYTYPLLPSNSAAWNGWQIMEDGIRDTMLAYGDGDKQVWMTELGAPTWGQVVNVTEAEQAQILKEAVDLAQTYSWAGPIMWFGYRDSSFETGFGLTNADGSHKEAYDTFMVLGNSDDGDPSDAGSPEITPDNITGTDFSDLLTGNDSDNVLNGLGGEDTLLGNGGNDTLSGGDGSDNLEGGDGDDLILGENGTDFAYGGEGNDTIIGGENGDLLWGNGGNDSLTGDGGNDTIVGFSGNDTLRGGDGYDDLVGSEGDDVILGEGQNDTLIGQDGNDTLDGGDGDDLASGGAGHDRLLGGAGNDRLYGINGGDTINGGDGDDLLGGGGGSDSLNGDAGNDTLNGGTSNDTLEGGAGNDELIGGDGLDIFRFQQGMEWDRVIDFVQGEDKIDLSAIDANANVAGTQDFNFIGNVYLANAGDLGIYFDKVNSYTYIQGDLTGGGAFDFSIRLHGIFELSEDDFIF